MLQDFLFRKIERGDSISIADFFKSQMELLENIYSKEDIEWNIFEHHTVQRFQEYIDNPKIYLEIVEYNKEIIGYIEAREASESEKIHIWWILIAEGYRNRGIAKFLYERLEAYAINNQYTMITASSKKINNISISFHKSMNYQIDGESEDDFNFRKYLK